MTQRILVIPQFNEERTIIGVLNRAYPFVDRIVVVDDGSTDASGALIQSWAQDHPRLVLLTLRDNLGMSGALLVGFAYVASLLKRGDLSTDDVVINIDADGQHLPEDIPPALDAMRAKGVDVLLGRRDLTCYPWFKKIGNWGLSAWASLLTRRRYHDVECGFRLMRAEVVPDLLRYFLGRRYGCAQEIGVITALRGWRVDNTFATTITHYRPRARIWDGLTNMTMGLLAFLRVTLGWRFPLDERIRMLLDRAVPPLADREEPPCTG